MAKSRSPILSQPTLNPPVTHRRRDSCHHQPAGTRKTENENSDSQPLRTPLSDLQTAPPPLSSAEKRLFLAQLVRLDLLDCLDDSGAFDLTRARRILSGGVVQRLTVEEVERTDRLGNTTVRRKIRVCLVYKLRAIKLDDTLEASERRARATAEAQRASTEQAAQESQARAAAYQQYEDIGKEVGTRVWAVLHHLFKDSSGGFPGITIETLNEALDNVSKRHPPPATLKHRSNPPPARGKDSS